MGLVCTKGVDVNKNTTDRKGESYSKSVPIQSALSDSQHLQSLSKEDGTEVIQYRKKSEVQETNDAEEELQPEPVPNYVQTENEPEMVPNHIQTTEDERETIPKHVHITEDEPETIPTYVPTTENQPEITVCPPLIETNDTDGQIPVENDVAVQPPQPFQETTEDADIQAPFKPTEEITNIQNAEEA